MPDLSADRPLLLPDAFTEEDVVLVGDAIGSRSIARIALRVLSSAGRLLPPSAEHREELRTRWQVQYLDKAFAERHAYFFDDRAEADECLATVRASPRFSEVKLLTKVSTPWVEVDGSES